MVLRDAIALSHAWMADLARGSTGRGSGSDMTTHDVTQWPSFPATWLRGSPTGRRQLRALYASWVKEQSFNQVPFSCVSSFSGPGTSRDWRLAGTAVRRANPPCFKPQHHEYIASSTGPLTHRHGPESVATLLSCRIDNI